MRSVDLLHAATARPVRLKIAGEIYPSTERPTSIKAGETLALMTGGAVPMGVDTIFKEEEVESDGKICCARMGVIVCTQRRGLGQTVKNDDLFSTRHTHGAKNRREQRRSKQLTVGSIHTPARRYVGIYERNLV